MIFDTRFRTFKVAKPIKDQLIREFGVRAIEFSTIVDYLILILHYLKPLKFSKTDLRRLIKETDIAIKNLQEGLNDNAIFLSIVGTDYKNKLAKMLEFI